MNKLELLVPCKIVSNGQRATASHDLQVATQPDLLFTQSVLVSVGENKNDDVFLHDETWKARNTPVLKPMDWEHQTGRELTEEEHLQNPTKVVVDNQTIGVMFNTYAVDENGVLIDDKKIQATNFEIPRKFHIVDEGVIWRGLFPNTAARVEEGAKNGTLFVSMEAWFTDYSYLVGDRIIARNEETAFLDSSLRANGGNGVYGNSRIKRILRNITFGGKGFVKRPANEPSVITRVSYEAINTVASKNELIQRHTIGSLNEIGSYKMSDTKEIPLELYTKASDENAVLKAECKSKDEALSAANKRVADLEARLGNIEGAFTKGSSLLDEQIPGFSSRITKGNPDNFFSVLSETLEADKSKREALEKQVGEALSKITSMEKQTKLVAREAKLDSLLGLNKMSAEEMSDEDKAKEKKAKEKKEKMMAACKDLGDEQFNALYEVWADTIKVETKVEVPAKVAATKVEKSEKTIEEAVKEVLAGIVDKAGEKTNLENLKTQLSKAGHSVSTLDSIFEALNGYQEPTDEDNLMALLDNVKASEGNPPVGEDGPRGVDLMQGYAGLVNDLLGLRKEDK